MLALQARSRGFDPHSLYLAHQQSVRYAEVVEWNTRCVKGADFEGSNPSFGTKKYGVRDCKGWSPVLHTGCSDGFDSHVLHYIGTWLSLVERPARDREVVGSNPTVSTAVWRGFGNTLPS